MRKSCFVACYDEVTEKLVVQNIRELNPGMEIIITKSEQDLALSIRYLENIIIYFDKFFLGYVLKYKLIEYKILNPNANIVFVEKGECPIYFGLRIYNLGVNSFICNLEKSNIVKEPFLKTFKKLNYYPEEILNSLKNNEHIIESKSCSEITEIELEIAMHIGFGKSPKEIGYLNNMASGTVGAHINRLRKKVGYKYPNDLIILNERTLFGDINKKI